MRKFRAIDGIVKYLLLNDALDIALLVMLAFMALGDFFRLLSGAVSLPGAEEWFDTAASGLLHSK